MSYASEHHYDVHRVLKIDQTCNDEYGIGTPEDPVAMTTIEHPAYYITLENGKNACFNAKTMRKFGENKSQYVHGDKKSFSNPPHHDFVDLDERLLTSASRGNVRELGFLLEMGANIDTAAEDGSTPLYKAAYNNHINVVKKLIKAGADVDKVNHDGWTPFYAAAVTNNTDVARELVKAGANIDKGAEDGSTPLDVAQGRGHIDFIYEFFTPTSPVYFPT
jgi:hypothetical protein